MSASGNPAKIETASIPPRISPRTLDSTARRMAPWPVALISACWQRIGSCRQATTGFALSRQHVEQDGRCPLPAFVHVDMRKRPEADHDVRVVDDLLGQVSMEIERDTYGYARAFRADAFEQFSSPSELCSETIAPCRLSRIRHGLGAASTIRSQIAENASAATGPLSGCVGTAVTLTVIFRPDAFRHVDERRHRRAHPLDSRAYASCPPHQGPVLEGGQRRGIGENVFVS